MYPSKYNAPSYPPEVGEGGVSDSEGEEVENGVEQDDDGSIKSSKSAGKWEIFKNKHY